MSDDLDQEDRRTGLDRRSGNGFELNTKLGSIKAFGDGLMVLLVIGMFGCVAAIFYLSNIVTNQLISLELSQRMTMCVLAVPDAGDRWTQITQPNSACSMLAKQAIPPK